MRIIITEKQLDKIKNDWEVVNGKLCKTYKFEDYNEVLDFVQKVGDFVY